MPPPPSPGVPSLPRPSLDLSFSWDQFLVEASVDTEYVRPRFFRIRL